MRTSGPLFVLSFVFVVAMSNAMSVPSGAQHYFWLGLAAIILFWALVTASENRR